MDVYRTAAASGARQAPAIVTRMRDGRRVFPALAGTAVGVAAPYAFQRGADLACGCARWRRRTAVFGDAAAMASSAGFADVAAAARPAPSPPSLQPKVCSDGGREAACGLACSPGFFVGFW